MHTIVWRTAWSLQWRHDFRIMNCDWFAGTLQQHLRHHSNNSETGFLTGVSLVRVRTQCCIFCNPAGSPPLPRKRQVCAVRYGCNCVSNESSLYYTFTIKLESQSHIQQKAVHIVWIWAQTFHLMKWNIHKGWELCTSTRNNFLGQEWHEHKGASQVPETTANDSPWLDTWKMLSKTCMSLLRTSSNLFWSPPNLQTPYPQNQLHRHSGPIMCCMKNKHKNKPINRSRGTRTRHWADFCWNRTLLSCAISSTAMLCCCLKHCKSRK